MPVKGRKKTQEYLSSLLYEEIQKDLLGQLLKNGADTAFYTDLVHDYLELWVTKCLLEDDIRTRGVTVIYNNGGGQKGRKKNDSVELKIKVTTQMLQILEKLGISVTTTLPPSKEESTGGEEDDGP